MKRHDDPAGDRPASSAVDGWLRQAPAYTRRRQGQPVSRLAGEARRLDEHADEDTIGDLIQTKRCRRVTRRRTRATARHCDSSGAWSTTQASASRPAGVRPRRNCPATGRGWSAAASTPVAASRGIATRKKYHGDAERSGQPRATAPAATVAAAASRRASAPTGRRREATNDRDVDRSGRRAALSRAPRRRADRRHCAGRSNRVPGPDLAQSPEHHVYRQRRSIDHGHGGWT